MKEKIITALLNLIKVKSLVTFTAMGVFVYTVVTGQLEPATTTAIIMLVFQSLFGKKKDDTNNQ